MSRNRTGRLLLTLMSVFAGKEAVAQPDVRLIRPNIMTLLDNSGSMEWRTNVANNLCGTDGRGGVCNQCSNGVSMCSPSCPESERRNRWTTAVEVLTGTIQNFTCVEASRNDPSAYDYAVDVTHHEPLSNSLPLFRSGATQSPDGIYDVYSDRVRFGLMTFDNDSDIGTSFSPGMFSYASNRYYRPGGCPDRTLLNLGVRRASLDNNTVDVVPGGLISVGDPGADGAALGSINRQIQESLVGRPLSGVNPEVPGIRPYGGTPIAAMLEDALNYWNTNPDVTDGSSGGVGDPYFNCRVRANILITDGAESMSYRGRQGNCDASGECPYERAEVTAMTMAGSGAGQPNVRTYVVGFNASDPVTVSSLTPIALAGNTSRVYYANDRPTFASALSSIIDTVDTVSSTRTPPIFGEAGTTSAIGTTQYQFSASFNVTPGMPWAGSLVRQRTVCQAPSMGAPPVPTPVDSDTAQDDDFGYNLRRSVRDAHSWGQRYLWTFVPTGASTPSEMQTTIVNASAGGVGAERELSSSLPTALFNTGTTTELDTMLQWLRGEPGTARETRPLGDIYRSTPTYVPPPRLNLPDQTFLAYRQRALAATGRRHATVSIGSREPMIYVGTNDGILHAFNADTGEEAWGFVPPYLVPQLRNGYPNVRTQGVDGTPVVKEIYYERSSTALMDDASWHTVLVVGLRRGGGAYVALDVTDPYNPSFLWQFTDVDLWHASGTPAIATLFFSPPGGGGVPVERAVALLPGGEGDQATGTCTATDHARPARAFNSMLSGWTSGRGARRGFNRCWDGTKGQFFYIVDLRTGQLVRKLGAGVGGSLPSGAPMVGSPAVYNGLAGVVTQRAYLGDADGTLWRVDLSSRDSSQWWMADTFDLYWDRGHLAGQPVVEKPVVSVDARGNTIIAYGSGDPETLDVASTENRIASVMETTVVDASGTASTIATEENWEIRPGSTTTRDLYAGERMVGAMTLFNNVLYFSTFSPRSGVDPCLYGFSRLWGVDLTRVDPPGSFDPMGRLDRDGDPTTTADVVRVTADLNNNGTDTDDTNSILFGVTVARRPTCNVSSSAFDPVTGAMRTYTSSSTGGEFRLVLNTSVAGGTGGTHTVTFARNLPPPVIPARVDSWATVFE